MSRTTLEDIARATGYSKAVISRVLNGKAEDYRISATTVQTILQACEEQAYRPNVIAQNLRNQTTKSIGLIVPYINYSFFGHLSAVIIDKAYKYGYVVSVLASMENTDLERKALDTLLDRNVDGILIAPCSPDPANLQEVARHVPLIQIDRYFNDAGLSYISTNNYEGAKMAMQQLIGMGHRNIHCIQGVLSAITTQERVRGVIDAAAEAGDVNLTVSGDDFSIQNGYVETKICIHAPEPPTAIFTLNNSILLGAIKALREVGKRIPQDISLISFDDNSYLDFMDPPITRMAQPIDSICTAAVKLLMKEIDNKTLPDVQLLMSPTIVKRESIKNVR